MKTPHLDKPQPPTCLHILGQGLVNALWAEGQLLKQQIKELEAKQNEKQNNIQSPQTST